MPSNEELKMLQALPLGVKVEKTRRRIIEFVDYYGEDDVYISFSGGKDSTVLLDICRKMYPNILAVFSDTGLEYPEIREFVKTFENVQIVRPEMNFRQIIENYGYPIVSKEVSQCVYEGRKYDATTGKYEYRIKRLNGELTDKNGNYSRYNQLKYKPLLTAPFLISNKCCGYMKKKPLSKITKKPINAIMTEESKLRKQRWLQKGCNMFDVKKPQSNPMSFWIEQDVLKYIAINNLPACSVYGDLVCKDEEGMEYLSNIFNYGCDLEFTGCQRTGCVFCGFGCHLEKGESRFERLKKTHPKLYDYCIKGGAIDSEDGLWKPNGKGLGMGFVFDWCNENIENFKIKY